MQGHTTVLLVIVFHLSACRYLEQSILALDMNDDVTKSHMPPVLSGLSQHLSGVEKSLQTNPGATGLMRQVKRLRMVSERMCQPQGR